MRLQIQQPVARWSQTCAEQREKCGKDECRAWGKNTGDKAVVLYDWERSIARSTAVFQGKKDFVEDRETKGKKTTKTMRKRKDKRPFFFLPL
jgi:hypothetical protein